MSHNTFPSLTGLRGILALIVVFEHVSDTLSAQFDLMATQAVSTNPHFFWTFGPTMLVRNGAFAVGVFFALSGFVLTHALCKSKNLISRDFLRFTFKRYTRFTLPVLALHLVILMAFQFDLFTQSPTFFSNRPGFAPLLNPTIDLSLTNTIYYAVFATPLLGAAHFNPVLWTIAVEFYGGLLVLLLMTCWRNSLPNYAKIMLGSLISGAVLMVFHQTFFIGFVAGSFTYLLLTKLPSSKSVELMLSIGCSLIFFVLVMHTAKGGHSNPFNVLPLPMHTLHHYIYYSLAGCCLIVLCVKAPLSRMILCNPPLQHLGQRSFSLYLVHYLIINGTADGLTHLLNTQSALGVAMYLGIILVLSFMLAEAFYLSVERPILRLLRASRWSQHSQI